MKDILIGYGNYGLKSEDILQAIPRLTAMGCEILELTVAPNWPTAPDRMNKDMRRRLMDSLQAHHLPPPVLMHLFDPFAPETTDATLEQERW